MPEQSLAQERAKHALAKIKEREDQGQGSYGNYRAYVEGIPATIITSGLGQALAMERAGKRRGHAELFADLEEWLLRGCSSTPYGDHGDHGDILTAITKGSENDYLRAQAETMAYLEWLKKFAAAYLQKPDPDAGEESEEGEEAE